MITVADLKNAIRIRHDKLDADIQRDIESAQAEMELKGIDTGVDDSLMDKAYELYVKAQLDYQGKGDLYKSRYEELRDGMALSSKYGKK